MIIAGRTPERVYLAANPAVATVEPGHQGVGPEFRAAAAVQLSGQVLDARSNPGSEANIELVITGRPGPPRIYGAEATGRFTVGGLDGNDQVTLRAERMGQVSKEFGPVTIGPDGLRDILLRLETP